MMSSVLRALTYARKRRTCFRGTHRGPNLLRLKRLLIEDAYPLEVARNPESRSLQSSFPAHPRMVSRVIWSPAGDLMATVSPDQTARLWRFPGPQPSGVFRARGGIIRDAAFSPDGQTLATAGEDETITLWSTEHPPRYESLEDVGRFFTIEVTETTLIATDNAKALAPDSYILGVDRETPDGKPREVRWRRPRPAAYVYNGGVTGDGNWVEVVGTNVTFVDTETGRETRTLNVPVDDQKSISAVVSPDERWLAAMIGLGQPEPALRLYRIEGDRLHVTETFEASALLGRSDSVAFSPDSSVLAFLDRDLRLTLYRLGEASVTKSAQPVRSYGLGVWVEFCLFAFSADGSLLVTADYDGLVVWRTTDLEPSGILRGLIRRLYDAEFSPDGKTLAVIGQSNSYEDRILLWSVATQQPVAVFSTGRLAPIYLKFSPKGDSIFAGGVVKAEAYPPDTGQGGTVRIHAPLLSEID
jgi:WD40 repeat protein